VTDQRRPTGEPTERLRTVSLRRRVVLFSLAVLAVVLALVSALALVFTGIGARTDLVGQLNARAALADQLARQRVPPASIVERVRGPSVWVRLVDPSGVSYDSSGAPPNSPKPVKVHVPPVSPPEPGGPGLPAMPGPPTAGASRFPGPDPPAGPVVRRTLVDGSRLTLYGDPVETAAVQRRLSRLLALLGIGGLGVAALALLATTRLALRPLDAMTALARSIAAGDRGRRLAPTEPGTELGRAAAAFDDMLDALEGAERTAKQAELAAKQAERTAKRAELTARRSEARTRQFVADAAHELRTPIAGLRAAAEAALSSRAGPEERDRLHLLLIREAGRAGRLVEDLLALAQIDAGLRLERRDVELRGLAEAEAERVRLLAPTLTVRVAGEPLTVPGDPQRLAQVLANLLDNARRHTPDGGEITVTVDRPPPPNGAGPLARVRVADTGPGVPAEDRERIFDRLVRLDDARSRDAGSANHAGPGGAGLGLAIARGIARAHGGELRCAEGSVFELTLPAVDLGDDPRVEPAHGRRLPVVPGRPPGHHQLPGRADERGQPDHRDHQPAERVADRAGVRTGRGGAGREGDQSPNDHRPERD
jgi:signal transduction histidine kinase